MLGLKDKFGKTIEVGDTVKYVNGRLYEITNHNTLYVGPGLKELNEDFKATYPIPIKAEFEKVEV
jgi:plastocyanin